MKTKPILHGRDHLRGGADPIPGLCMCEAAFPLETEVLTDSVQHWWRFREAAYDNTAPPASRSVVDSITNNSSYALELSFDHLGEVTAQQAGPSSQSYSIRRIQNVTGNPANHFSGENPNALTGIGGAGDEFTIEAYFKLAIVAAYDLVNLTGGCNDYLVLNADGSVTIGRQGVPHSSAAGLIQVDTWYYLCYVVGAGRVKLYVNPGNPATPVIDAADPGTTVAGGAVFDIGTPNGAGGSGGAAAGAFQGNVAEVAVYDEALPPDRVRAHYVAGFYGDTGEVPDGGGGVGWDDVGTSGGGSSIDLDDLADVNAPTPADGDVLTWDATPGEWVAAAGGGGGGAGAVDVQVFTTPGAATWTKPAGAKAVRVICIGAGGSGGSGCNGNTTARAGGSGGGGGAVTTADMDAADVAGTITVTVGAGGASKAGTATTIGTDGDNGGASSFGALLLAGGGGKGQPGGTSSQNGGGGGSQNASANGANGGTANGGAGAVAADAIGGQGPNGAGVGRRSEWGGGSGGGSANAATGNAAGPAIFGGGGGGGGGGCNASNTGFAGAAGGGHGYGALGGGGAGGAIGAAGTPGATQPSPYTGTGGGGGGAGTAAAGQNGAAGGVGCGGGGGGAGTGANAGGASGAGGNGKVIVITW